MERPFARKKGSASPIVIYCDLWFDAVYRLHPRPVWFHTPGSLFRRSFRTTINQTDKVFAPKLCICEVWFFFHPLPQFAELVVAWKIMLATVTVTVNCQRGQSSPVCVGAGCAFLDMFGWEDFESLTCFCSLSHSVKFTPRFGELRFEFK